MDIRKKVKGIVIGTAIISMVAFPCIAKTGQPLDFVANNHKIIESYNAKHVYKDPLFKLTSEKHKSEIAYSYENMQKITDIVNKIAGIAGITDDIQIYWTDNDEIAKEMFGDIGFASTIDPDNLSDKTISANSQSLNSLSEDEAACIISHEIGHLIDKSAQGNATLNEISGVYDWTSDILARDDFSPLLTPVRETFADKASVVFAGQAGYDVTQFKSGLEILIMHESAINRNVDKNLVLGIVSYPSFIASHPSYGARMLQHEEFIKEYQQNPEKMYKETLNDMVFSMGNIVRGEKKNPVELFEEIQKHAKANLTDNEYNEILSSTKGGKRQIAEAMIIKELDKSLEHRVELERRANVDFFKQINKLNGKELENVLEGLEICHKKQSQLVLAYALMTNSEQLANAIEKRVNLGNEIYMQRAEYVVNKLKELNYDVEIKVAPIDFKKKRAQSKEIVVDINRGKNLKK